MILITVDWQEPILCYKIGSTDWEKANLLLTLLYQDLPIDDIARRLVDTV